MIPWLSNDPSAVKRSQSRTIIHYLHFTSFFYLRTLSSILFLIVTAAICAQSKEIEDRISSGVLKMTFPGVYFKHGSADYAPMPYTADSCYKYIAFHFDENVNSLVIWRDSAENELLTKQRIKKIKAGLIKQKLKGKVEIQSMDTQQKVSGRTIALAANKAEADYLRSLNSVFDFSKSRIVRKAKYTNHIMSPSIFCWGCWKSGFHLQSRMKFKKAQRKRKSAAAEKH